MVVQQWAVQIPLLVMKKRNATWIIGRADRIDLPEFGIEDLECKVDTGADTSSIHCSKVKLVEVDGEEMLKFRVLDRKHPLYSKRDLLVSDFTETTVKSSNGVSEQRYVVRTRTIIFGEVFDILFTLSDREKMKYPVLLGKHFLKNKFIVDVAKKDLSYRSKNRNHA